MGLADKTAIAFISGEAQSETEYNVVYTLTSYDTTTANSLNVLNLDFWKANSDIDLVAPIKNVVSISHFENDDPQNIITNGVIVYDSQMTTLTGGSGYQDRVDAIKITITTIVTLQPEEYFKWIFLNEPTDVTDRIKTGIGFQSEGVYENIVGSELEVGDEYAVTYTFIDYDVDLSLEHENEQKDYFGNDVARLYAPIKEVKVTRTDINGASSYYIARFRKVVLDGYESIQLSSGTLYEDKLEEISLRVKTTVTMQIGEIGGENYQYL